jgi:hypothetical protein
MVTEHGPRAFFDKVHDGRDRPLRIGAIADIVAEEHVLLCAKIGRLRKTGAERLSIRVNVCEHRDEHSLNSKENKLIQRGRWALILVKWCSRAGPEQAASSRSYLVL